MNLDFIGVELIFGHIKLALPLLEEENTMEKYFYTIVRKYYGIPDYLNDDLSEEYDCCIFDTEAEAAHCIKTCFNNGEWINDERYGKVRYYYERRKNI